MPRIQSLFRWDVCDVPFQSFVHHDVYKSWAISTTEDLEFGVNMLSSDEILDLESEKI